MALKCWDPGQAQKLRDSDNVCHYQKTSSPTQAGPGFFKKVFHCQVEMSQFLAFPLETPVQGLGNPLYSPVALSVHPHWKPDLGGLRTLT